MLGNSNEMLQKAKQENKAIGHFNINNLEWTKYILETCEEMQSPVILGVSEGAAKYMGGFLTIANLVKGLIKDLNITIEVCLHLDHGKSFSSCKEAIDAGFTSVMIDASKYPLEENIKLTKEVVDYAHERNVSVEAEIGHIGRNEASSDKKDFYARVDECEKLVNETKVDSLAPALGSVHGIYQGEANLDFITMEKLKNTLSIPLVLHGGTGIPLEKIKRAIDCGINKININTELQIAWSQSVRKFLEENPKEYDPRSIISSGEEAVKDAVRKNILLFSKK